MNSPSMTGSSRLLVLLAILLPVSATPSSAQISAAAPVKPGPVTLQLRTGNGKSRFHRGEIIPIELVFASPESHSYTIGEECTPRETYRYSISPMAIDRAVDVDAGMSMYFGNCHGFSSQADPGKVPLIIRQLLNERFRIAEPGPYKFSVTTNKLGFPLTSNTLQIEILPGDAAWERSELDLATALLSSPYGSETWQEGCRALRYLETPQAELEMARREDQQAQPCDFDIPLISARKCKLVLDQLERGLSEPGRAISGAYLRTLALVSLYQQHPDWYPKPSATAPPASEFAPSQQSGLWSQRGIPQAEEFRYARLLAAALDKKTPEARSQSLKTLLYLVQEPAGADVPTDLLTVVREQMPAALPELPPADREAVLRAQWYDLKTPAMLPVLRDLVEKSHWLGGNGIALIRLNELSPAAARPVIMAQLRSPNPQGSVTALSLLPERELPDLDAVLLERLLLEQNDGGMAFAAGLLRRYASPAVAAELEPWFSARIGKMYCGTQAELIAYFLRVAPADGAEMLHTAMQSDNSGCVLLRRLAHVGYSPELEKEAITALDDSRPEVIQEALQLLRENGSPASREILLQHFRMWHDHWSVHAKHLLSPDSSNVAGLESGYADAIGSARNWLSTAEDWRTLQQLCVTRDCQDRAEQTILNFASPFAPMIEFSTLFADEFQEAFALNGCQRCTLEQLHAKMLQYPAATRFLLDGRYASQTHVQRCYSELQPWAVAHRFSLQIYRN